MAFRLDVVGYYLAPVVAIAAAAPAAGLPSPAWLGVERVEVDCDFGDSISSALADRLCEALAAEADGRTSYPVHIVRDHAPRTDLDEAASTLVLKVDGRVDSQAGPIHTLRLDVRAERPEPIGWHGPSRSSSLRFRWDGASVALLDPAGLFVAILPRSSRSRRPQLRRQL